MPGLTLEQCEAQLVLYLAAEAKILTGQSYTINTGSGSRTLTRANLDEVQKGIETWNKRIRALDPTRKRIRYAEPDTQ